MLAEDYYITKISLHELDDVVPWDNLEFHDIAYKNNRNTNEMEVNALI